MMYDSVLVVRRFLKGATLLMVVTAVALSKAAAQSASGHLTAPAEVVLYVHSELRSTAFVEPLVCMLKRVLVAPVSAKDLDLPLGPGLAATRAQLDANRLGD